jgi:hypothetical protein
MFLAVPDITNVVIASARTRAGDNRMSGATRPQNANRLRNEHKWFFIVDIVVPFLCVITTFAEQMRRADGFP